MPNVKNLVLDTDESVLWTRKPEPGPIMAVGFVWTAFFIGGLLTLAQYVSIPTGVLMGTSGFILVFSFIHFWFAATQTRYILTNKRLFVYDGGIRPVSAAITRDKITNIRVEHGRAESVLNTGRIVFETDDEKLLTLSSLPHVNSLAEQLVDHMPNADIDPEEKTKIQAKGVTWPRSFAKE